MAFLGNLMNNYFYGKAGQKDYGVSDMPANRLELFGTVLRVRWSAMVGLNLLYMIAWLPALIWSYIGLLPIIAIDVSSADLTAAVQSYLAAYLIGLIPCIAITGPFTAGFTYVLRNWARDEHSFVWSDYWENVRNNWKQGLGVSCISGVLPFLAFVALRFYGQLAGQNPIWLLPLCLVVLVFLLWTLAELVVYTMMVTYRLTFAQLIRNGILLSFARLPHAVGIKLLTLILPGIAVALIYLIPGIAIHVILVSVLLYLVFIPAFHGLIKCSFANAVCEKYLNSRIEGARTNIGLRPENWDDTEYLPEDDD